MPNYSPTQSDRDRIILDRLLEGRDPSGSTRSGRLKLSEDRGTPRFAGQVFNAGAMPQGQNAVYMVHPIILSGSESEGGVAGLQVDTSRAVPVIVIGSRQVVAGDTLVAQSVGGRWIAESGTFLPNCNPQCSACPGSRYAASGTVTDAINGTQPITYDFAHQAWYSAWLPFHSPYVLQSGAGYDPCMQGNGTSYYFYQFTCSGASSSQLVANLFLPGESCHNIAGQQTTAYFSYSGPNYPGLLGSPANSTIAGFTLPSAGQQSSCNPMTYAATWGTPGVVGQLPLSGATFSVPKFVPPPYGYTCSVPCPLPRKNLTVSWTNSGGNGSGTLTWSPVTGDWTMACANNLTARLYNTGSSTLGLTISTWDGASCSGTQHPFSYPTSIGLTSLTCQPLDLSFNVLSNTSTLYLAGYRTFTVTE